MKSFKKSVITGALLCMFAGTVMPIIGTATQANAAPVLTGAMVVDGDSTFVWSTKSYGYYLFVADGAMNGPMINDAGGHISYILTPGIHTFYIFGDWDRPGAKNNPWGLSLNFDGQLPPSIGVTTPEATSAFTSQVVSEQWVGSSEYNIAGFSVKLEDFNIYVADHTGYDRVSPISVSANGRDDAVGEFTLSVMDPNGVPVPEPATLSLFAAGLGAIGLRYRRRKSATKA